MKMRRCFTDPHYWKNPALRRSREKMEIGFVGRMKNTCKKVGSTRVQVSICNFIVFNLCKFSGFQSQFNFKFGKIFGKIRKDIEKNAYPPSPEAKSLSLWPQFGHSSPFTARRREEETS